MFGALSGVLKFGVNILGVREFVFEVQVGKIEFLDKCAKERKRGDSVPQ